MCHPPSSINAPSNVLNNSSSLALHWLLFLYCFCSLVAVPIYILHGSMQGTISWSCLYTSFWIPALYHFCGMYVA